MRGYAFSPASVLHRPQKDQNIIWSIVDYLTDTFVGFDSFITL